MPGKRPQKSRLPTRMIDYAIAQVDLQASLSPSLLYKGVQEFISNTLKEKSATTGSSLMTRSCA